MLKSLNPRQSLTAVCFIAPNFYYYHELINVRKRECAYSLAFVCIYVYIYVYIYIAASTPLRKDTGVFESFGRFIIVLLD